MNWEIAQEIGKRKAMEFCKLKGVDLTSAQGAQICDAYLAGHLESSAERESLRQIVRRLESEKVPITRTAESFVVEFPEGERFFRPQIPIEGPGPIITLKGFI